jgi:hypothetical protein
MHTIFVFAVDARLFRLPGVTGPGGAKKKKSVKMSFGTLHTTKGDGNDGIDFACPFLMQNCPRQIDQNSRELSADRSMHLVLKLVPRRGTEILVGGTCAEVNEATKRADAATMIQRNWRKHQLRTQAAAAIRRGWRKYRVFTVRPARRRRLAAEELMPEPERRARTEAATTIQRNVRKFLVFKARPARRRQRAANELKRAEALKYAAEVKRAAELKHTYMKRVLELKRAEELMPEPERKARADAAATIQRNVRNFLIFKARPARRRAVKELKRAEARNL